MKKEKKPCGGVYLQLHWVILGARETLLRGWNNCTDHWTGSWDLTNRTNQKAIAVRCDLVFSKGEDLFNK